MIKFNAETELTITIEVLAENMSEKDIADGLEYADYSLIFGKSVYSDLGTIIDITDGKVLATVKSLSAHKGGEYYEFERKR